MFDQSAQKKELRKSFLALRAKLRTDLGNNWEEALVRRFDDFLLQSGVEICGPTLSYFPIQNEPKILPAPEQKPWYFPKTTQSELQWFPWTSSQALPPLGKYGIPEADQAVDISALLSNSVALCFTPALAADKHGHRLGYGKGFYDRFFARPDLQGRIVSVVLLHEMQLVDELPADPHDRRVDLCVTNERFLFFTAKDQVLRKLGN